MLRCGNNFWGQQCMFFREWKHFLQETWEDESPKWNSSLHNIYLLKTKLQKGKVFTHVCLSTRGLPSHNTIGRQTPSPTSKDRLLPKADLLRILIPPPKKSHPFPPRYGQPRRGGGGRYASYWNAYLCDYFFLYVRRRNRVHRERSNLTNVIRFSKYRRKKDPLERVQFINLK